MYRTANRKFKKMFPVSKMAESLPFIFFIYFFFPFLLNKMYLLYRRSMKQYYNNNENMKTNGLHSINNVYEKFNLPITKTYLFKYTEKLITEKLKIFRLKNSNIFHISAQKIDCGHSLEPPRRGGSNEYQQSMFLSRNK